MPRTDLPNLSPVGKSGWTWEQTTEPGAASLPAGRDWPKISIVTPSFNQADFLEETIRSVLLQGYPNLEYILIDGGSTDGSLEIVQKYAPWLAYWVSETDSGQSQALNKGFVRSSGEIMAWLNSDDRYAPGALFKVAQAFMAGNTLWAAGLVNKIDAQGRVTQPGRRQEEKLENWYVGAPYLQPGIFWRRELWQRAGQIDEGLQYSFDYDLLMRFVREQPFAQWVNAHLADFREHPASKTCAQALKFMPERRRLYRRYPPRGIGLAGRVRVWVKRRERQTRILMSLRGSLPAAELLGRIFLTTPWKFFSINFLYWVKVRLLFPRKEILLDG
jgi:glycosyltransferase involved in cell wall biosynthesis